MIDLTVGTTPPGTLHCLGCDCIIAANETHFCPGKSGATSVFAATINPLTLTLSEPLPWRWSIAPGCYFTVRSAPNRFHRFMQRVFLGLHWEKNP